MDHDEAMQGYYDLELPTRVERPLGRERAERVARFAATCRSRALSSVVEIGCRAGRDGTILRAGGLAYTGVDLSGVGVEVCRARGLTAVQGSAVALPFADDTFDAGWSMSTLMHLPGDGLDAALAELARVVRAGGVVTVGLWGADVSGVRIDEDGRYFRQRTDRELAAALGRIGHVGDIVTWGHLAGGGHYQYAEVVLP